MQSIGGDTLRDLYAAHGAARAAWIHDKPLLAAAVRAALDRVVDRVLEP